MLIHINANNVICTIWYSTWCDLCVGPLSLVCSCGDADTDIHAFCSSSSSVSLVSFFLVYRRQSSSTIDTTGGRSAKHLSSSDREALLSQYDKDVLDLCAKCYTVLKPLWKEVRNEFKHNQIKEFRGHIVNYYFADRYGNSTNRYNPLWLFCCMSTIMTWLICDMISLNSYPSLVSLW